MTKKLLITLSILTLFANATKASDNNSATHDEGVVINGVRWATRNVDMPGTFAETPESSGMFFQWGRKKAWNAVDEDVEGWDNSIPEGTKWYAKNDPCPEGWRVPTDDEFRSLINAGSEWVAKNNVYGRLLGDAPYQIFLPAAGWRNANNGTLFTGNKERGSLWGLYWSSTRNNEETAWKLFFTHSQTWVTYSPFLDTPDLVYGRPIRCVAK